MIPKDILCCFWDLESTGLRVTLDNIIQIGCTCRLFISNGKNRRRLFDYIRDGVEHDYTRYVKTGSRIPTEISNLTGITNRLLDDKGTSLRHALDDWENWIHSLLRKCPRPTLTEVWFIAHNGNQFDLPLLFYQEMTLLKQQPGTFLKQVSLHVPM
ncbi:putative exonuclease [Gregarina niphandrodes]|uniref:Exonuclease n=1 Tax=Gregarina niphandrodes TaxID=110365 RepID=A0A023BC21_GRENI|nr:putative exonuclease [Gregarina niphandrodes]EZG81183.1 putative exonuclease [Gregarina niphandrodes]|eukprot:XP_011134241.1 putative exonuclease [Gregarina niphandrodes]